jgi:hypothetical protein
MDDVDTPEIVPDDVDKPEINPDNASKVVLDDNTIKPFRIDPFVNTTKNFARDLFEEHANSGKAIKTCPKN